MSGAVTILPEIAQGADYELELTRKWLCDGQPDQLIDMTGYTAVMQLRRTANSHPVVTLTHTSGISFGGANGKIFIVMTETQTAAIPPADYLFDLKIASPAGQTTRLIEGRVRVSPEVSRVV